MANPSGRSRMDVAVETLFTASLLVFSLAFIWQSTLISEPPRNIVVGPRTAPTLLGVLMLMVSAVLLYQQIRSLRTGRAGNDGGGEVVQLEEDNTAIRDWAAVWVVLGALLALFALLETLGFILAFTLFVFGLSAFFDPKRWRLSLIVAPLFSLFFYMLFTHVLGIALPAGFVSSIF